MSVCDRRMWGAADSAGASRSENNGWQIVVAERPGPAELGLKREHDIAGEVGAGTRNLTIFIWRSQRALIVARRQAQWSGFEAAATRLAREGWPVLCAGPAAERSQSGRAPCSWR